MALMDRENFIKLANEIYQVGSKDPSKIGTLIYEGEKEYGGKFPEAFLHYVVNAKPSEKVHLPSHIFLFIVKNVKSMILQGAEIQKMARMAGDDLEEVTTSANVGSYMVPLGAPGGKIPGYWKKRIPKGTTSVGEMLRRDPVRVQESVMRECKDERGMIDVQKYVRLMRERHCN